MMTVRAVVFDLDGVLVDTSGLHARAWKEAFDELLAGEGVEKPFDQEAEYRRHVDGKPRYEGARDFIEARGIDLPMGTPDDPPGRETISAVGNLKNARYRALLEREGVERFPGTDDLLDGLMARGIPIAVVSSSRNALPVLEAGRLADRFSVCVTGRDVARRGLRGKPHPAMFLEAAEELGVAPESTAVIEDAVSGVQAGRRGGFGLVVGVDPNGSGRLTDAGADLTVRTVAELGGDPAEWGSTPSRTGGSPRDHPSSCVQAPR